METVCLDDGDVRLDGDKSRLDGILVLPEGTVKRFSVVDSTFGRVQVSASTNNYVQGAPQLDQLMAYYHIKWMYQRIYDLGYAETHLPDTLTIDVHGSHNNAFFKPEENLVTLGYHQNESDGVYYWYGADGEVVLHELGHAIVHEVQPDILTTQGAAMHEAYADYLASSMNGDPCVGEYASYIHDELLPSKSAARWRCTRTLNEHSSQRPYAYERYAYHHEGPRKGETDFHSNSIALSHAAFAYRFFGDADTVDRLMLHALLKLEVDVVSAVDDGEVLKPRLGDWYSAMVAADNELYSGSNASDLGMHAFRSKFTQLNQMSLREEVLPNNDLENKVMPWLSWSNFLRTSDGDEWLKSDEGYFWSAFLASASGGIWFDGLQDLPVPSMSQQQDSFAQWMDESGLLPLYDPADAWHAWLTSSEGQLWLEANVEPAWRAFTERVWRAWMDSDAWCAFVDTRWRTFVAQQGADGSESDWRAFLEAGVRDLILNEAAWRAFMTDDAWRALLGRSLAGLRGRSR